MPGNVTELITDPVVSQNVVPNGMAISPWFDWSPILGIPIWIPIAIILVFGVIMVWVYWYSRVSIFKAVAGWKESAQRASQGDVQTWVISRVKKLTIECMTIKDNILSSHDERNISMFHVNSGAGIIKVGGIPGVVVSEDFDQNRDFITEIALVFNCDAFNHNQEQLKKELKEKHTQEVEAAKEYGLEVAKPQVVRPIEDCEAYETYGRKCLSVINPDGLEFPSYSMFDPQKFRKYFPRGCSAMWFGGELIHDARKLNLRKKEKGFWEVHAFLAGAIVIGMIALIVSWLFPIGV